MHKFNPFQARQYNTCLILSRLKKVIIVALGDRNFKLSQFIAQCEPSFIGKTVSQLVASFDFFSTTVIEVRTISKVFPCSFVSVRFLLYSACSFRLALYHITNNYPQDIVLKAFCHVLTVPWSICILYATCCWEPILCVSERPLRKK